MSKFLSSFQVPVIQKPSSGKEEQITVIEAQRARFKTDSDTDEMLAEAFTKTQDLEIILNKNFKSAVRSTKREVKALQKRVEKQDLKIYSYLKAYETALDKVAKFSTVDPRQASLTLNSLREIDALVTQVMMTSRVEREIAQTWARLSLGPWITTSMIFREKLMEKSQFRPNISLESVKVRLPSYRALEDAIATGKKIIPRIRLSLRVDDPSVKRLEVYSKGFVVKTRRIRISKKADKPIRIDYKAPLGINCLMFYDSFDDSFYVCLDTSKALNFYMPGSRTIDIQKTTWLPNGQYAGDLNKVFIVRKSLGTTESGFVTF
ncbi:MAG: hypothetical protein NZO16_05760 [Deltaproteobacteria bacterium]|nr:hypothetical protein [Deltaproteobacteria bacterium]